MSIRLKRYFTSDLHFFDEGILWYCDRPWKNAGEMLEALRENFLDATRDGDEIYMLGDICTGLSAREHREPVSYEAFRDVMTSMGIDRKPFYLLRGNHDLLDPQCYTGAGFVSAAARIDTEVAGYRALLCHDPALAQRPNTLCLCGHVHCLFREYYNAERNILAINVGVDVRGYRPVSEDEIADIIARHGFDPDRVPG